MNNKKENEIEISGALFGGLAVVIIFVFVIIGLNFYSKHHKAEISTKTVVAPEAKEFLVERVVETTEELNTNSSEVVEMQTTNQGVEVNGVVEFRGVKTKLVFVGDKQ